MKTYKLIVTWAMSGTMFVEAKTPEEAKRKAILDEPIPSGEYVPYSFEVLEIAVES